MLRIIYDDREEFPWLVVYGPSPSELRVWGKYRDRETAELVLRRLGWLVDYLAGRTTLEELE